MKVGVITFWDSHENYGQVLQAYALQVFLEKKGHEAFLIRYDKSTAVKQQKPSFFKKISSINWTKLLNPQAVKRKLDAMAATSTKAPDRHFDSFREEYLKVSPKIYRSLEELQNDPPEADVYICGSDQVWNYKFLGDYRPFFLQFGSATTKRFSYAASFGHRELPAHVADAYKEYLSSFDGISVRELSGTALCEQLGYQAELLPDPTLLLGKENWEAFSKQTESFSSPDKTKVFIYTLGHRPSRAREALISHFSERKDTLVAHSSINKDHTGNIFPSIREWLGYFHNADVVITNSFHGMAFSVLFNKNFIGLPCTGDNAGMNERLTTLMNSLGLEDHLLYEYDQEKVNALSQNQVDWKSVNEKLAEWRLQADGFLSLQRLQRGDIRKAS